MLSLAHYYEIRQTSSSFDSEARMSIECPHQPQHITPYPPHHQSPSPSSTIEYHNLPSFTPSYHHITLSYLAQNIKIYFRLHTLVGHQPTTINKQTALSALLLVKEEGRHQPTAINKTNKHVLLLSYWSISTNQKLRQVDIFKSASRAIT